jgi:S1-C subfamily serine protease
MQPVRTRRLQAILADGRTLPAQVLALDEGHDLAALSVNAAGLSTIAPGDSKAIRPGQWVMALGHPWGVRDALTAGVVIGTGDNLPEMQPGREWIALNLTLRPGHSGGPLLDMDGTLLGVNTMISGPEVGYAVPAHVVKRFLRDGLGERVTDSVITVQPGAPIQSV